MNEKTTILKKKRERDGLNNIPGGSEVLDVSERI